MKELWNNLKTNKWFWIIIVIVSLYIIYYIYNWIKGKGMSTQYDAAIKASGVQPTLTPQSANNLAQQIYQGLSEDWFNNFDAVKQAFAQIKNDADLLLVEKEWGSKTFGLIAKDSYSLEQALNAMLSPDQLSELNSIMAQNDIKGSV